MSDRRSATRPGAETELFGTARHWSAPQAVALTATVVPIVVMLSNVPPRTLIWLLPIPFILLYAVALFWIGFRYRVYSDRLEIWSPLRVIRRVRAGEIEAVERVPINALFDWGGWGVRGIGRSKAYILGGGEALRIDAGDRRLWLGLKHADELPDLISRIARPSSAGGEVVRSTMHQR